MTDPESDTLARGNVFAGLAVLAVGIIVLTWQMSRQPPYGDECAAHYEAGSLDWKMCIQRLRLNGDAVP